MMPSIIQVIARINLAHMMNEEQHQVAVDLRIKPTWAVTVR